MRRIPALIERELQALREYQMDHAKRLTRIEDEVANLRGIERSGRDDEERIRDVEAKLKALLAERGSR
jgi:vacuolar-type H+-ATPase subunit I/STV1